MPESLLKVQNLSFAYEGKKILENLSLAIESNEIVSIIGKSGSGKTTLFKILTGLLSPQEGTLTFSTPLDQTISYMTQEDLLLPWRTVLGNLTLLSELGSNLQNSLFSEQEALSMLEEMGLANCSHLYPDQLSGGMRQRVSLARTLLQRRPLLLLDEPFGAIDVIIREQIYTLLRKIKEQHRCTILMITHDFHDALFLSDRILLLNQGIIHKSWHIGQEKRHDPLFSHQLIHEIRQVLRKL